jgi:AraC-like DNA-binding protein
MERDSRKSTTSRAQLSEGARLGIEICAPAPRSEDYWHVNLDEPWEIAFWSRELGCSEDQLRAAVEAAGARAGDVKGYLAARRWN